MIKFFIFAAGKGKRARPLSYYKPKPSFPIKDKPLINLIIEQIPEKYEIFINLYYKKELLKKEIFKSKRIKIIEEEKLSGNLVLKETLKYDYDKMVLINGDILLKLPIKTIEKLIKNQQNTIFIKQTNSHIFNKLIINNGLIEKTINNQNKGYFYTGIAIITRDIIKNLDNKNIINFFIENRIKLNFYDFKELWFDIGNPENYYNTVFSYLKNINEGFTNSLSKNVIIDEKSNVTKSIIWENTRIINSRITNCIICNNLEIKNKELKNSIVTNNEIYPLIQG